MKYTPSILAAVAALAAGVSGAATPKMYRLHVTQPSGGQNQSVTLNHSGAGLVAAALTDPAQFAGSQFYFQDGRLFSQAGGNLPPFGISFSDVGDSPGAISGVYGQLGLQGRDDWTVGADGSVTVPPHAAPNSFLQCNEPVEGGFENSLVYGNPYANGSLPQGCTSSVLVFATPV